MGRSSWSCWASGRWTVRWLASAARWLALALTLAVVLLPGGGAAAGEHSAGIVVRHGDGTLVYVWVSFDEDSITSEELLTRSGLEAVVTPFGGLGTAVCSLDGEGCPSSDCFCKSYSSPAFFWHFYTLSDGTWVEELGGASSREVRDGDIDGWSWTAAEPGLPVVTLDEIAALNGVREAPAASPTGDIAAATEPAATEPPATRQPTTRAVVVPPDGTPVVHTATPEDDAGTSWPLFAGMAGIAVAVAGLVVARRRKPRAS